MSPCHPVAHEHPKGSGRQNCIYRHPSALHVCSQSGPNVLLPQAEKAIRKEYVISDFGSTFKSLDSGILFSRSYIGRTLQKFTQLKRNKRFDNIIMLVWVLGSPFHIAAESHPVEEVWGSQDSLYRGQIQKLLQFCREPYQQIPLVITIQKKYSLTYLRRTV